MPKSMTGYGRAQRLADGRNPSFTPDGKSIIYDRDRTVYRREVTK